MEAPKEIVIRKKLHRITMRYLFVSILDALDVEKGFLFSLKSFFLNPKSAFEGYLNDDRYRHSNPFKLAVVLTAITVFLTIEFGFTELIADELNDGYRSGGQTEQAGETSAMFETTINEYYNVMMLAALPVLALSSLLFYKKTGYNYAEHLTLNCFMFSVTSVMYCISFPLQMWSSTMMTVYVILSFGYQIWVYRSALGGTVLRAFMASLTGYVIYFLLFVVVMILVVLTHMANW